VIRYAGAGRRTWAFVLTLLVDLVVLGTIRAMVDGGEVAGPFLVWYLIHHVGLVVEGGTIGQRLAGLRVTRLDGTRVRVAHAFAREFAFVALSLPPLGLGLLWMLDQPERRTWHDLVGGTVVVRERAPDAAPAWADAPPWRTTPQPAPPQDS
jgi:uncharacterized RDD family membrane protein YckC